MGNEYTVNDAAFSGRIVLYVKQGNIIASEKLRPEQHLATLPVLIEIMEKAGFQVINPPRSEAE